MSEPQEHGESGGAEAVGMTHFTPGDRVFVTDPALAELRAIFARATGKERPNHHGTIDEVWSDRILIIFDDGGSAPYPADEVRHLSTPVFTPEADQIGGSDDRPGSADGMSSTGPGPR